MTNLRTMLAASAAALTLASPALAAPPPVGATPAAAKANARIIQPLVLTSSRNLNFGDIVMGTVAAGGETVTVSQAGALTGCGVGGLTCSGTVASAAYNVQGTNNQWVQINASGSTLTNTTNGGAGLAFAPSAPARIQLTNSGAPGTNFTVGGSIIVMPANLDGVYSGDINVTVQYE